MLLRVDLPRWSKRGELLVGLCVLRATRLLARALALRSWSACTGGQVETLTELSKTIWGNELKFVT